MLAWLVLWVVIANYNFAMFQKIVVERVTRHMLQGKLLLQIEVSMPQSMLIRY